MTITKADLLYDFPESLIAQTPVYPPRVLLKEPSKDAKEINFDQIIDCFQPQDLLVINTTKVLPRRIFLSHFDILFLESPDEIIWTVLFAAKKFKIGDVISIPGGVDLTLQAKGRPQTVVASRALDASYFEQHGHFALPPYIQSARQMAKPMDQDKLWYQTSWADQPGSLAAPTASLHFKPLDLAKLKAKITIAEVTLHVGLGTFLPITAEDLADHQMHNEYVEIKTSTVDQIRKCQEQGGRVWALGTTSLRSLEAFARGHLKEYEQHYAGQTNLFIKPGDDFKIVGGLLTNFHQPGSTLIALVSAFASLKDVKATYRFAIENKFRLFSYGDLSVWLRP
jgi:S-adenosylmethionine:tRNA ribosyltransferase-isomerase